MLADAEDVSGLCGTMAHSQKTVDPPLQAALDAENARVADKPQRQSQPAVKPSRSGKHLSAKPGGQAASSEDAAAAVGGAAGSEADDAKRAEHSEEVMRPFRDALVDWESILLLLQCQVIAAPCLRRNRRAQLHDLPPRQTSSS